MEFKALDSLDETQMRLVRQMLSAVVDSSDKHVNRISIKNHGNVEYSYFVGQTGSVAAIPQNARLPVNIVPVLTGNGWMRPDRSPGSGSGWHAFTDEAIAWYRENRLTDEQIRERLGRYLYRRFEQFGYDIPSFDLDSVATELDAPAQRIDVQARLLIRLKYAQVFVHVGTWSLGSGDPSPSTEPNPHLNHLHLTDEGLRWAVARYPAIAMGTTVQTVVNVDVHVAVKTVIEQARRSEVDQDLLVKWEGLMRRLEDELAKPAGQGNFQTAKDVIETASASKDLLGPTITFFSEHWDKIRGLIDASREASGLI